MLDHWIIHHTEQALNWFQSHFAVIKFICSIKYFSCVLNKLCWQSCGCLLRFVKINFIWSNKKNIILYYQEKTHKTRERKWKKNYRKKTEIEEKPRLKHDIGKSQSNVYVHQFIELLNVSAYMKRSVSSHLKLHHLNEYTGDTTTIYHGMDHGHR